MCTGTLTIDMCRLILSTHKVALSTGDFDSQCMLMGTLFLSPHTGTLILGVHIRPHQVPETLILNSRCSHKGTLIPGKCLGILFLGAFMHTGTLFLGMCGGGP